MKVLSRSQREWLLVFYPGISYNSACLVPENPEVYCGQLNGSCHREGGRKSLEGWILNQNTDRLLLLLCSHNSPAMCLVSLLICLQIYVCDAPTSLLPKSVLSRLVFKASACFSMASSGSIALRVSLPWSHGDSSFKLS